MKTKTFLRLLTLSAVFLFVCNATNAQVTIGAETTPDANAVLDLKSTSKGLLLPRVELTATDNFSPLSSHVQGMTVYNTKFSGTGDNSVTPGMYYNNGSEWVRIISQADDLSSATLIYVDTTDPNIGTSQFSATPASDDEEDPGFIPDAGLGGQIGVLYSSSDGSIWTYNGTDYITYTAPASTAWNIYGTNVDAGGNKTVAISRKGNVNVIDSKLYLVNSGKANNGASIRINNWAEVITTSASNIVQAGITSAVYQKTAPGVTNSGRLYGVRAYVSYAGNNRGTGTGGGTIASLRGVEIYYGHLDVNTPATATTTNAYGLYITSNLKGGKIGTTYDIYATAGNEIPNSSTKQYGIYIAGEKINVLVGKLGVGTSAPVAKMEVRGYLRISGSDADADASPAAGMIRLNGSNLEVYLGTSKGWKIIQTN